IVRAFVGFILTKRSALPIGLAIIDIWGQRRVYRPLEATMFAEIRSAKIAAGLVALVALVFSPLLRRTVYAQVAGATLSGTVTDQSGGVVPQAAISIKNVATGIERANTSNAAGFYSVPNLLPGTYEVRASAKGFSTELQ